MYADEHCKKTMELYEDLVNLGTNSLVRAFDSSPFYIISS